MCTQKWRSGISRSALLENKQIHKILKVLEEGRPWDKMICGHIAQGKCYSNRVILPGGCMVIEVNVYRIRKNNIKSKT
jgi:hypothetical protein